MPFKLCQQRQVRNALIGVVDDALQQIQEMLAQETDELVVEQIRAVFDRTGQLPTGPNERELYTVVPNPTLSPSYPS